MARSILTGGRTSTRSEPGKPAEEPGHDLGAAAIALKALQEQIDRLTAQLGAAGADLAAARAETAAERATVERLRAQLMEEHQVSAEIRATLAGAQAARDGLAAQLEQAREAQAALKAPLEQAIAAAGAREPINFPAHQPVAYDVVMMDPDTGRSKKVSIKPRVG